MPSLQHLLLIGAFLAGMAVAGAMSTGYDRWIDDPAVVRETRAVCEAQTRVAAALAELAERKRQQAIAEEATRKFNLALQNAQQRYRAETEALENEIAAFEDAGGSTCSVTVNNLEFLQP